MTSVLEKKKKDNERHLLELTENFRCFPVKMLLLFFFSPCNKNNVFKRLEKRVFFFNQPEN